MCIHDKTFAIGSIAAPRRLAKKWRSYMIAVREMKLISFRTCKTYAASNMKNRQLRKIPGSSDTSGKAKKPPRERRTPNTERHASLLGTLLDVLLAILEDTALGHDALEDGGSGLLLLFLALLECLYATIPGFLRDTVTCMIPVAA